MKRIKYLFALLVLGFAVISCDPVSEDLIEYKPQQKSVIVYMVANNDLSSTAEKNLSSMLEGYLPAQDNLLVYYHVPTGNPLLLRLYKDETGAPVQDTVYRFPSQNSADPKSLENTLKITKTMFPAQEYGLILWSHASGWLPKGYYAKVRSFGLDGTTEMDFIELVSSLPFKFNFVLFDACLMGGIEVAYELKDLADYVIASPTEVMSDGFPYAKIMEYIFKTPMELESVAEEYFNYYNEQSGLDRSATISVVKTSELDEVAAQAKRLFENYGSGGNLNAIRIDTTAVQKYYRSNKHWFYDFQGMMKQLAGDGADDFINALNEAVIYKASTPNFLGTKIDKDKFSGLSTYIPSPKADSTLLDYYSKFRWNKDTGYIQYTE